jgi:hypothetical protein
MTLSDFELIRNHLTHTSQFFIMVVGIGSYNRNFVDKLIRQNAAAARSSAIGRSIMKKARHLFALAGFAMAAFAAAPAGAVVDEGGNVLLIIITDTDIII